MSAEVAPTDDAPVASLPAGERPRHLVGQPLSNAETRLLDEDDVMIPDDPPRPVGRPLSNAETRKLDESDLRLEDARSMPESRQQDRAAGYTRSALEMHFADRVVTVERNMHISFEGYDEHGERPTFAGEQRTAARFLPNIEPDVLVAFDVPRQEHRTAYLVWREGKVPDFLLEVASNSTWRNDYGRKRDIYERLGVPEYFIFDARKSPRRPRLTACRPGTDGRYQELRPLPHEGVGRGIFSAQLRLVAFVDEAGDLGWWDPEKQAKLRRYEEAERRLAALEAERQAKDREIEALREQLAAREADTTSDQG